MVVAPRTWLVADHQLPAEWDLLGERVQALVVACRDARLRLDLDCHRVTDQEVDLDLRLAAPVAERRILTLIVEPTAELEEDQVLQRSTVRLRSRLDG